MVDGYGRVAALARDGATRVPAGLPQRLDDLDAMDGQPEAQGHGAAVPGPHR